MSDESEVVGDSLNDRQRAFVEEYLIDLNATRAAIRAGYSPTSAHVNGPRLLANAVVAAAVHVAQSERSKRTGITAERVLQELANVAFSDIADVVEIKGGELFITDLETAPAEVRRAIESVSEKPGMHGTSRTVKMHSKLAALKMLTDHLGMSAPAKLELSGPGGAPIATEGKLEVLGADGAEQIRRKVLFGKRGEA